MKRWSFVPVLLLTCVWPALAQVQGGSITGTMQDDQGGMLPGVAITLQGVDATQSFTTGSDGQFRFLNLAPGPYKLTATLPGFTTLVHENVMVSVGKNVELPMTMKVAAVAEAITVSAESPVVDVRATGTATNFTSDELTKIPTSAPSTRA